MSSAPQQHDGDQETTLAKATYCTDTTHFYTPHARDLIGRLLRQFLDTLKYTPTEVLHSLDCQKKLITSGNVLEAAVQRIALAQVKDTQVRATQRIKEIHALIETLSKRVRGEGVGYGLDDMSRDDALTRLRQTLPTPDSEAKDFKIYSLASKWLEGSSDWVDKLKRVVALFDAIAADGGNEPGNVAFGDMLLGEILRSKAGLDTIIGDFETLAQRLVDIANLYRGTLPRTEGVPDASLSNRIALLFAKLNLPSSRAALVFHIASALSGRTNIESRDVVVELQAIAKLTVALRHEKGYIGGIKTFDLIERRLMRTLSVENLGEKLRQLPEKVEQVRTLVTVHDILIGQQNKRLVRNYVEYVMEDRQFLGKLLGESREVHEQVKRLGMLHKIFAESGLVDGQREKYSKFLADTQDAFIRKENLFAKLDRDVKDPAKKAVLLMRVCESDGFVAGPHLETARKLIGHYVMKPEFLMNYLAGSKTREIRSERINELKRLLLASGIDESFIKE